MERVSFEVTDYHWDTEKSSDIVSMSGSSPLMSNSASVKDKRIGLVKRLASVSNQLKRLTWVSGESKPAHLDLRKSTAFKGLRFISEADGVAGWSAVEKRFVEITATSDGLLPRSRFGECIGMDSRDFASELFDALARRRHVTEDMIDQGQFREFWEQINQSFDSRLQIFFDMIDKDANGRLTEDEVREIINLSSSTNNLSNIQKRTDEYAAMIMEEFDPDNMGYIMIESLETLLLHAATQYVSRDSGERKKLSHMLSVKLKTARDPKPLRRWYSGLRYFVLDSWQRGLIPLHATVASVLHQRRSRHHRADTLNLIETEIRNLKEENREGVDIHLWKSSVNRFSKFFRSKNTWNLMREQRAEVMWYKGIWFSYATPKHQFQTWVAMHNRLSTGDRIQYWGVGQRIDCIFCAHDLETRNHLFFECPFSSQVWRLVAEKLLARDFSCNWNTLIHLLHSASFDNIKTFTFRYVFQSTLYHVWRERNNARHGTQLSTSSALAKEIDKNVRNRFTSIRKLGDTRYEEGIQRWFAVSS